MNEQEDYKASYEAGIGADRMALGLSCIPHTVRGDMLEVMRLRSALEQIKKVLKEPAANRRLMQIANPARQCINIVNSTLGLH